MIEQTTTFEQPPETALVDRPSTLIADTASRDFNRDYFSTRGSQDGSASNELPPFELVDSTALSDDKPNQQMEALGPDVQKAYELLVDGGSAFADIDRDGDALITKDELEQYVESGSTTPPQSQTGERQLDAATQMLQDFESLSASSNDEWGFESAITRADLEANFSNVVWEDQEEIMSRLVDGVADGHAGYATSRGNWLVSTQMVSDLDNAIFAGRHSQPLFPFFTISIFDRERDIRFKYNSNDEKFELDQRDSTTR